MNDKDKTMWTAIWVFCICVVMLLIMIWASGAGKFYCTDNEVGCANAIMQQFPEGHGK